MENYTEMNTEEYDVWVKDNFTDLLDSEINEMYDKCQESEFFDVNDEELPF